MNIHFGWIHFQGQPSPAPTHTHWDCAVRGWGCRPGRVLLHAGQGVLPAQGCTSGAILWVWCWIRACFPFLLSRKALMSTCLWLETSQTQMPWLLHCVSNVKRWHCHMWGVSSKYGCPLNEYLYPTLCDSVCMKCLEETDLWRQMTD